MDISLMVEGQNGLTWDKWSNILRRSEDAGLSGVFRSDHFFIGTQQDSLEPYLSFTMAALQTERIRFGPLVTPVTFRPPVNVGRMAAQLDQLSNGRFVMGLGGGWNESEHVAYGVPFPPVGERLSRLEEAIHVMRGLWGPGPASYEGRFYTLKDADCLPKPPEGRPTLLIGGGGERRTMRFAAQYADEWNCLSMSPEAYTHKVEVLQAHCDALGRDPSTLKRSMMTFGVVGPDPQAGRRRLPRLHAERPLHVNRRHYVRRSRAGHDRGKHGGGDRPAGSTGGARRGRGHVPAHEFLGR